MSDNTSSPPEKNPLVRMASAIRRDMSQLIVLVVMRWLFTLMTGYVVRTILTRFFPSIHRKIRATCRTLTQLCSKPCDFVLAAAILFYTHDAFLADDNPKVGGSYRIQSCRVHTIPRPVGIAAALSLLVLMTTSRLGVSTIALGTLLAVSERSVMSGVFCVVTLIAWMRPNNTCFILALLFSSLLTAARRNICNSTALSSSDDIQYTGRSDAYFAVTAWIWLTYVAARRTMRTLFAIAALSYATSNKEACRKNLKQPEGFENKNKKND